MTSNRIIVNVLDNEDNVAWPIIFQKWKCKIYIKSSKDIWYFMVKRTSFRVIDSTIFIELILIYITRMISFSPQEKEDSVQGWEHLPAVIFEHHRKKTKMLLFIIIIIIQKSIQQAQRTKRCQQNNYVKLSG